MSKKNPSEELNLEEEKENLDFKFKEVLETEILERKLAIVPLQKKE